MVLEYSEKSQSGQVERVTSVRHLVSRGKLLGMVYFKTLTPNYQQAAPIIEGIAKTVRVSEPDPSFAV